ncbi:MAG: CpsD/CapB family tyrosine-protein kinase [Pseudomonadota bacterium]
MEKLQAALNQARRKRGEHGVGLPEKTSSSRSGRAQGPKRVQEQWAALPEMELSSEVLEKHRVVTKEASPAAAPFDVLRTKILVQMRKNGWRRLAITSPTPQSGKTTTACNLSLGLGRQDEMRTILLDLDLRSPSMSEYFDTKPNAEVGQVLTGQVPFAEQAMRIGDNVAVSMSSTAEKDPSRLLLAEETAEILDQIETLYRPDIMIFDLPSVLVNDDTRAFLKNVDCALIVVRANKTRYGQFDSCEREIAEQTNVLGVVLNADQYGSDNLSAPDRNRDSL